MVTRCQAHKTRSDMRLSLVAAACCAVLRHDVLCCPTCCVTAVGWQVAQCVWQLRKQVPRCYKKGVITASLQKRVPKLRACCTFCYLSPAALQLLGARWHRSLPQSSSTSFSSALGALR